MRLVYTLAITNNKPLTYQPASQANQNIVDLIYIN